jgi:tetratricopeptide (TPR) repeat protein
MKPRFNSTLGNLIYLGVVSLALTWLGCDRRDDDYAQYEQRAWQLMHQENREELLATVILSNLNRAIDLAPDRVSADSYRLRAHCWDKVGEEERAFQDRMVVIERDPNNPNSAKPYAMIAGILHDREEYQQAREYIDRSIELVPDCPFSRGLRIMLYVDMGIMDQWEEDLRVLIELDPSLTNHLNREIILKREKGSVL